jgi:DNA-binding NarL/FixJ family response regulator
MARWRVEQAMNDPRQGSEPKSNTSTTDTESIEFDVGTLSGGLSPRTEQLDMTHVAALADVFDDLPPVIVHASTNRLIDGAHRLRAAIVLGRRTIRGRLWEGSDTAAEIEAIHQNVTHGKGLTRRDRENAVRRVLQLQPDWSDRRVAHVCGVAPPTVTSTRRCVSAEDRPTERRVGRDGRARAIDPAAIRRRIAEIIDVASGLSDREVARRASGSQATVRDVRSRLARGESVLPTRMQRNPVQELVSAAALRSDATLTAFADWLARTTIDDADWMAFVDVVPVGRIYELTDEARRRSTSWRLLAEALDRRIRTAKA